MASVFYHPEKNRQRFFAVISNELEKDVYNSIKVIFANSWRKTDSNFWIKQCICLMAMMVENVYLTPIPNNFKDAFEMRDGLDDGSEMGAPGKDISPTPNIFTSVVELCFGDDFLTEYVWMELFPSIWKNLDSFKQMVYI